jgi:hypothetical protein
MQNSANKPKSKEVNEKHKVSLSIKIHYTKPKVLSENNQICGEDV